MNAGVVLSQSAANYLRLEIFVKDDEGYISGPFYGINGKTTQLTSTAYHPPIFYTKSKGVDVNGTAITTHQSGEGYWTGIWGSNGLLQLGDYIAIIKVIGYK